MKRISFGNDVSTGGYSTIGEVSEATGVKSYILRYWEKEFPFLQPLKNKAGHRLYTRRDIQIVRQIRELLYDKGYSISGAKKVLWDVLLGKKNTDYQSTMEEIVRELREVLDTIERTLSGQSDNI